MIDYSSPDFPRRLITQSAEMDRALLAGSGLFDEPYYRSQAFLTPGADALGHYLRTGWTRGLQPNADFPAEALQTCFENVGLEGPAAVTWAMTTAAGWRTPATRQALTELVHKVRNTGLFDERFYREQATLHDRAVDALTHYVLVGERLGLRPSNAFDPGYYARRSPDAACHAESLLLHYHARGCEEGGRGHPLWVSHFLRGPYDPARENVIIGVHETSRTGAPVLGWNIARCLARQYNVFTVRLGDGELTPDFEAISSEVHGPFPTAVRTQTDLEYSLRRLFDMRKFRYAIINSAGAGMFVETCASRYIPTVLLVHEFASYVHPLDMLRRAFDWSGEIVFPAPIVARAAQTAHPPLQTRHCRILPQGVSVLPSGGSTAKSVPVELVETLSRARAEGDLVLLGAGTVAIRKGVDLFIAIAAAVMRAAPVRRLHFVWIGHGFRPTEDMEYSVYLQEQVQRSGLQDHLTFVDEVPDLEPFYALADAFLLTSRLDPLPNVAIDAVVRGLPIVCFKDASGIADLLLEDATTATGVVPYLDVQRAADALLRLVADDDHRRRFSDALRRRGAALFDMERYVAQLDALAESLSHRIALQRVDADTLAGSPDFHQDMVLGTERVAESRAHAIARYIIFGAARQWSGPATAGLTLRRPAAGFDPRIWANAHPEETRRGVEPYAEFVRRGRPGGPWQLDVLRPPLVPGSDVPRLARASALHAHIMRPELAAELLLRLGVNRAPVDLIVSTDTAEHAAQLSRSLSAYRHGAMSVHVVPRRANGILAMVVDLADALSGYEVVGHVASEPGPAENGAGQGGDERVFLWENLLGGQHAMLDVIVSAIERRPDLGLVFPSDPHLTGRDDDHALTISLAASMGFAGPLPQMPDFPSGGMFWVRREVLDVLARLRPHLKAAYESDPPARKDEEGSALDPATDAARGLLCQTRSAAQRAQVGPRQISDRPISTQREDRRQPSPVRSSMVRTLRRLLPVATSAAGLSHAVTHVPGVSW